MKRCTKLLWKFEEEYQGQEGKVEISIDKLPILNQVVNKKSYLLIVLLECERTNRAFRKWQTDTYDLIIEKYQRLKDEYESKLEQLRSEEGMIGSFGRNPELNKEIIKNELKKSAIVILRNKIFDPHEIDAIEYPIQGEINKYEDGARYPEIKLDENKQQSNLVRFFEQAFEWHHLTYVFYPYFWARKEKWPIYASLKDSDPQFEKFLQAGRARVRVPVRPGHEEVVLNFLNNGCIWSEADLSNISNENTLDIVQEIKEGTGDYGEAVPVGEPWEVKVPTSLVILQKYDKDPVLPKWDETGSEI